MTREQNEKLALSISAIINIIDNIIANFSIGELRENLPKMEKQIFIQEALPFPSTQNVAQKNILLYETYKAIVDLAETRKNQSEEFKQIYPPFVDEDLLKNLGIL